MASHCEGCAWYRGGFDCLAAQDNHPNHKKVREAIRQLMKDWIVYPPCPSKEIPPDAKEEETPW